MPKQKVDINAVLLKQVQQLQQLLMVQEHADQQEKRTNYDSKGIQDLRMMADLLEDVQDQIEPIRDRALDEKARLTGFAQCAETCCKILANKSAGIRKRAIDMAKEACSPSMSQDKGGKQRKRFSAYKKEG